MTIYATCSAIVTFTMENICIIRNQNGYPDMYSSHSLEVFSQLKNILDAIFFYCLQNFDICTWMIMLGNNH